MRRLNEKRGEYYYYVVLSVILVLIIVGIIYFWLFQEFFTNDDVDLEICRQSIGLRNNIPDLSVYNRKVASFKDIYPLKCKTQVVTIDYENVELLEKEIANTIAGCWFLYGEGKYSIFPVGVYRMTTVCVPCARVHLTPKVEKFYSDKKIDIQRGLSQPFKDTNYLNYLNKGDGPFAAFIPGNSEEAAFRLVGGSFEVRESEMVDGVFSNRLTGATEGSEWYKDFDVARVYLPKFYDPNKGDLLVFFGSAVSSASSGIGSYFPYLFYLHSESNYLNEFDDTFINAPDLGTGFYDLKLCATQEGIPA